ncbi:hypothetical protein [Pajaroellobacter abortibovis]|uniref:hypothetical protein n=1 Tax=Pajaroellobacter abortibovis TaxID=1882918 RepID=UPI0012EBD1C3|nr:hypothetical protein [Pajaroellobacter abortibovis]
MRNTRYWISTVALVYCGGLEEGEDTVTPEALSFLSQAMNTPPSLPPRLKKSTTSQK